MGMLTSSGLVAFANSGMAAFAGAKLKLFSNDFTPTKTSTNPASFTAATFTGYATKTLGSAPTASANGSNDGQAAFAEQRWDPTSSQTIYGWYITNAAEDAVLAHGKESVALSVVSGAPVVITPTFVTKNPA